MQEPKFLKLLLAHKDSSDRGHMPGGGGNSHAEQTGMLVGNFEFNP